MKAGTGGAPRRTVITVTGATRVDGRWSIRGTNARGRTLKFRTTSARFAIGQRVAVTHHTIRKDGTLVGARFSKLENVTIPRKMVDGSQKRTRSRSFSQLVAGILNEFRDSLGQRPGEILLEGHVVRLIPGINPWFKTEDGVQHSFGRQVGEWLLKQGVEA